jgi:hypothetical protein
LGIHAWGGRGFLWASTHGVDVTVAGLGSRLDPPSTRLPGCPEKCGKAARCTMPALGRSVHVVHAWAYILFCRRVSAVGRRRGGLPICLIKVAVLVPLVRR